ncbi:MAG: hypothetical protein QOD87_819 [Pseudonocardiales bacterium]|jgi:hypothetical protein|nr:hypothetical protein [Pseudonocardiales bacterium]
MATIVSEQRAALPIRRPVVPLLVVLLALALGGWRIVSITHPHAAPGGLRVDGLYYTVSHVEQVTGLSEEDLSGMSHGIQGLVTEDKALLRVSMTVRSGSRSKVYDPSVLTVRDDAGGDPIAPAGGSLAQGGIGPHAQLEGSLSFIVPRNGHHYRLRAPHNSHVIDLISVDLAPTGAGAHQHGQVGPSQVPSSKTTTDPVSGRGSAHAVPGH